MCGDIANPATTPVPVPISIFSRFSIPCEANVSMNMINTAIVTAIEIPRMIKFATLCEIIIYYMFNFGFATIFAILGILIMSVHIPKDAEFTGYRKSRYTLGWGFTIMAVYCIFRILIKQEIHTFFDFWILITVSLLFSWLNYTAFLFLIKTTHKIRQHFVVDGIVPLLLMLGLGICGLIYPDTQSWVSYLLGAIFLVKCIWMFYTCDKEWCKVYKDLEENYDFSPNILWMRRLVWLTFVLSVLTLIAWYIPALHVIYAVVGPSTHLYMVLKMVNYSPEKICNMRTEKAMSETEPTNEVVVPKSLILLLEPKIQQWIEDKRFCRANLSIKDVALEIGTNHSYLSKYLNSNLNVSFQQWLNTLRIEESKRIFASENLSVEEVGARVGIPLGYNFSRWFKIVTGETPFKYRQRYLPPPKKTS